MLDIHMGCYFEVIWIRVWSDHVRFHKLAEDAKVTGQALASSCSETGDVVGSDRTLGH